MESIYRRKWKDKAGNVRESDVLWIKYYRDGRPLRESAETTKESEARKLLKLREGDVVKGVPITPKVTRVRFAELADDVVAEYEANGRRSIKDLQGRLRRHILPVFGHRRAASITTADINRFISTRRQAGAAPGEINRELGHIKRAFTLGVQAAKILQRPHIPMLAENNVRKGFFEREQFEVVRSHLPEYLEGAVTFMYITGWRSRSEVLTLRWSQVDFKAGFVSLHAGETKNQEARSFPITEELRAVLEGQRRLTDQVQRERRAIIPWVFHRQGKPIRSFRKAWAQACYRAGLPCHVETTPSGRVRVVKARALLHDFRRTAVRNLVRAGVPERVAMQLTGHKTRSVFERYNIVSEGDLMEAAAKLNHFHATRTGANRMGTSAASASVAGTNPGTIGAQGSASLPQVIENKVSGR